MTQDTQIGGPSGKFPATRWLAVRAARSTNLAGRKPTLETITVAYWKPICKYTRIRWKKTDDRSGPDVPRRVGAIAIVVSALKQFSPAVNRMARARGYCDLGGSNE
jgi:hypothetical protein